jgi:iron(III) transport system ATP-binding protein
MLDEFAQFHAKTGATMVYITHDQEEAMALADRIAVMDAGRLVQAADPRTLYREPASAMVGGFVGRGAVVPATVLAVANDHADVEILGVRARLRCAAGQRPGPAMACLRPEDLAAVPSGTGGAIDGRIARSTFRGAVSELDVAAREAVLRLDMPEPQATPTAGMGAPLGVAIRGGWVIPGG